MDNVFIKLPSTWGHSPFSKSTWGRWVYVREGGSTWLFFRGNKGIAIFSYVVMKLASRSKERRGKPRT